MVTYTIALYCILFVSPRMSNLFVFIYKVLLSNDSTGSVVAELVINGANLDPFPTYRLVTFTNNQNLRAPNHWMRGLSSQRLLVSIQNSSLKCKHPASLEEKLKLFRDGQSCVVDISPEEVGATYQAYFAGCFEEDCDII